MTTNLQTIIAPKREYSASSFSAKLVSGSSDTAIRRFFWALSIALGFLQAWASRSTLSSDAVSYVDIGGFLWHGQWSMAVNGLWNPLYSLILGVVIGLARPSVDWEYPLIHLVLLAIFVLTLWSYDFLLRQLVLLKTETASRDDLCVPSWIWLCIGYVLFLWLSLRLIQVSQPNPDMLVAATFFLACGLLVKLRRGYVNWSVYVLLGLALGLGYLTKSIMFPVSLLCLASAFVVGMSRRRRILASLAVFLAVSGPYIVALSAAKHRLTFGDSGRYNYAVHVNGVPEFHWEGGNSGPAGSGQPLHSSRVVLAQPATFEFGSPIGGTYPAWTDPTYWHQGMRPRFHLHQQLSTLLRLLGEESFLLFELHGSIIGALFVLFYMSARKRLIFRDLAAYWFLMLPCLATLIAYATVHVEPRYLGPFLGVLLLSAFFAVRLPRSPENLRLWSAVALLLIVMFFEPLQSPSLRVKEFVLDVFGRSHPDPNSPAAVAKGMYALGLKPGDRIASLQQSDSGMSTWACLAHVRIVAEVDYWPDAPRLSGNDFWKADAAARENVIRALGRTGASYIVSQLPPPGGDAIGWHRVANSQYYAFAIQSGVPFNTGT